MILSFSCQNRSITEPTTICEMDNQVDPNNVTKRFNKISLQKTKEVMELRNNLKLKENAAPITNQDRNGHKIDDECQIKLRDEPKVEPEDKMKSCATSKDMLSSHRSKKENIEPTTTNNKVELKDNPDPLKNKKLEAEIEPAKNGKIFKAYKLKDSTTSKRSTIPGIPETSAESLDVDRAGVDEEQIKVSMERGLMSKRQYERIKQLKEMTKTVT